MLDVENVRKDFLVLRTGVERAGMAGFEYLRCSDKDEVAIYRKRK